MQSTSAREVHAETSLRELALLFLRLGATAFGGPAVHIAMMKDEVVRRRAWLDEQRFLDLLGATNLIPGPNSTELAIHIGWQRRGFAGLVVAGVAFIVPAMLITTACGWAYVRYATLPAVAWLLYGVKPVVLSVVVRAVWELGHKALGSWPRRGLGVLATGLAALGVNEVALIFGAGALAVLAARGVRLRGTGAGLLLVPALPAAAAAGASAFSLSGLFWVFLKIGSLLFGSGYVLLAFLRADLVLRLGWLTEAQVIDAVAVGQITPGPVFTTATFIGYVLAGPSGALLATAGIFLPAFVFVALSGPLVPRIRAYAPAGVFLDGVNIASLALMAVVSVQLARAACVDWPTVLLALAAAAALIRFDVNPTWLIAGGAAAGWLLHRFGQV